MRRYNGNFNVKRSVALLVSIVILLTLFSHVVMAEEQGFEEATVVNNDMPSDWAMSDVQMANLHMIGSADNYNGFRNEATSADLLSVQSSLNEIFNVKSSLEPMKTVSRQNVIDVFYDVIQEVLIENRVMDSIYKDSRASILYFVETGLIAKKESGDYSLERICTKQELLVFAKRVYDHIVHAIDIDAKGAFWKVSDEDNTVYLLGSIHLSDASIYPLNEAITDAYEESEILAVEANIYKQNDEDMAYLQQIMFLEGETTIEQLLQPETYEAYEKAVSALGYFKPEVYNKFKPWYAALLLQNIQLSSASYVANLGVDFAFLAEASNKKPIVELEGTKFLLDMFNGFSKELQEQFLIGVLASGEKQADSDVQEDAENKTAEVMAEIISLWKSGDVEALEVLLFSAEAGSDLEKEYVAAMWETRNNNMSTKVAQFLKEDSSNDYFVVVGAGHMLSETGIVQQLTNMGYTVEQIK